MTSGELFLLECEPMLAFITRGIHTRSALLGPDDLLQEARIWAFKAIQKHQGPFETLTGYVAVCVRRALYKLTRRTRDRDETDNPWGDAIDMPVLDDDITHKTFSRQVATRVFQLVRDPTDRRILQAFMAGVSDREAAASLQMHHSSLQERRKCLFQGLNEKLTAEGMNPDDDDGDRGGSTDR